MKSKTNTESQATKSAFTGATWKSLVKKQRPAILLAIDPGETSGWSVFRDGELADVGQIGSADTTHNERIWLLHQLIWRYQPTVIVCEDYRIYASKRDIHIGSNVPVAQLIGAILLSAQLLSNRPQVVFQLAGTVKGFFTNDKLKRWGLYQTSARHSNDAIRHSCYFILFGKG